MSVYKFAAALAVTPSCAAAAPLPHPSPTHPHPSSPSSPVLRLLPQVLEDVGDGDPHVELEVEGARPLRVLDVVVQPQQHGRKVRHDGGVAVEEGGQVGGGGGAAAAAGEGPALVVLRLWEPLLKDLAQLGAAWGRGGRVSTDDVYGKGREGRG